MGLRRIGQGSLAEALLPAGAGAHRRLQRLVELGTDGRLLAPLRAPTGRPGYGKPCGWTLARAHATSADVTGIVGYLGSVTQFDGAMGQFALAYADRAERNRAALKAAVRKGTVQVQTEA
jgi:hypothetical protein